MKSPEPVKRLLLALQFWPSFGFERLMTALGLWRRWDWIDARVALGALPTRRELAALQAEGVTGIVNFCAEFPGRVADLARLQVEQLYLPTLDYHCPTAEALRRGVEFIERHARAGGKVLLHCKAGQGRSATLAVVYLAHAQHASPGEAYRLLREIRPQVSRGLDRRRPVSEALSALRPEVILDHATAFSR